ncbi:hypothetical protein BMF94_2683 [Rhodotorula taiwanensis]|uniref:Extracellular membrane protein CFEM domain-containing protein n=1 Tax=Rhodotorula taiwanensis TaxID=741276 RepID=A0A2S5BBT3_9BASI|nr:hypothetical protein BMF94_2683 [Rhodotorula taiwanensis]
MVQLAFAVAVLAAVAPLAIAKGPARLLERQSQTLGGEGLAQVQGLMDLATNVANDIANGNASTACTNWVNALQACSPDGSTANASAVAVCACGSNVVAQLTSCAPSYGSTGVSEASGFSTFCNSALASLVNSSLPLASASGISVAPSSASSGATSAGTKGSTSPSGTATAAGASASAKSGAGRTLAVSGLSVGLVSVAAALLL